MYYFNNIFQKVFVINLKVDKIKRELIKFKFKDANINFEFFDAVNGYEEPHLSEFKEYYKKPIRRKGAHKLEISKKMKVIKSPGAYGYLKTWEKILSLSIEKNYKNICVFDDDVLLDKNFNAKFNTFINEIKSKWAVINLGSTQHEWNNVKFLRKKNYYLTPENTDGSFAVCIKRNIFSELLKEVRKFNCSFDSGPLRYMYQKYNGFCYTIYPAIVIADVYKSSIREGRNLLTLSKNLKWNLENINYKIYLNILISVILPVHNNEDIIADCLDNLLNQTYKCIEIIIIDNNSDDNSINIIDSYVNNNYNVKVIKNNNNENLNNCKNIGLDNSNGDFVVFYNINIISNDNRFEIQLDNILKKGLLFCSCNCYNNFNNLKLEKYCLDSLIFNKFLFNKYRFSIDVKYDNLKYLDLLKKMLQIDIIGTLEDLHKNNSLSNIYDNIDFSLYINKNINNSILKDI